MQSVGRAFVAGGVLCLGVRATETFGIEGTSIHLCCALTLYRVALLGDSRRLQIRDDR